MLNWKTGVLNWLFKDRIFFVSGKHELTEIGHFGFVFSLHPDQQTGKVTHHIQYDAYDVNEFEYKLNV